MKKISLELLLTISCGLFLILGITTEYLSDWHVLANLCYLIAYITGGYFGVLASFDSIKNKEIDVDLLMMLAALGAAFVGAPFEGGMLLFLFALSNVLQSHAMDRSRKAIQSLMQLRPSSVSVLNDGQFRNLKIEDVCPGDIVRVKPGESLALDGIISKGNSSIDESSITGESIPVEKSEGNDVYSGTINQTGSFEYKVTKLASDSTLSKIIHMVENAQSKRAKTQRFLDTAEQYYAMGVILLTLLLIFVPPLLSGADFNSSFYRAMTVMVVASPCALIISTPAAFLSAIGGAARKGVLFKGGVHLERLAEIDTVAFDKTGTLTEGKPQVQGIETLDPENITQEKLLQIAAAIETLSEHPLARAIETEATKRAIPLLTPEDFHSIPGKGALARIENTQYAIGNRSHLMDNGIVNFPDDENTDEANTTVWLGEISEKPKVLGRILIADTVRAETKEAIQKLKKIGIKKIVMLTGDQQQVAEAIAKECGIDQVGAELLPEQKVEYVSELSKTGKVAMIGDGVNDAPALATSHVGIAMGAAGTDVAMETADVVLMSSNLHLLDHTIALARASRRIVIQNLTFALGIIAVLVVCALTIGIPLPLGVVGHEGSTVLVCLNGLRLLRFKM